jgi:hypothetical protein
MKRSIYSEEHRRRLDVHIKRVPAHLIITILRRAMT